MTRRPLPTFVCYIFAMVGLGAAAWTLASVGGSLPVQAQQPAVQIVVHADQILAPVNRMLFGQNFGPWMNTTPEYVEMYQDLGVSLLRFPGGNYGDENNLYPNNVDDLAALAQALDAEVSVQTRLWRAGTPEKAAELVRYANVKHNYGFRYWEIGNEPDLYMVNRRHEKGDPVFDVAWYNNQFRAFSQAMKAVDPSILIAGPVVTGGWPEWMPAFIQANGDIVDVLSWHWYAHGNEMNDEAVLATPPQIEDQVQAIRAMWTDPEINPLGYQRPVPPLFLSEYNISWATRVRRHLGSQVGALWNAEVVGRMANQGVEMAAHFALQGTDWQGLAGMLQDPRPVYGVYRLYSQWGDRQLMTESMDEALLPAFASLRPDGALAVLLINKDPERTRSVSLKTRGFRPAGQVQLWLQDAEHLGEAVSTFTVDELAAYTAPPYSVTLLIIPPANILDRAPEQGIVTLTMLAIALFAAWALARRRSTIRDESPHDPINP